MKKKIMYSAIVMVALVIGVVGYYLMPKIFLKNVDPSVVDHINVFDGNTGMGFTISNPQDIKYIVENIQGIQMKKTGISLGRMGYGLKISFIDSKDKDVVPLFIINNKNTIRKDPFFYACEGELCFEYIRSLEPNLSSDCRVYNTEGVKIGIDDVIYVGTGMEVPIEPDESIIEYVEIPAGGDAMIKAFARISADREDYLVCLIGEEWYKFVEE